MKEVHNTILNRLKVLNHFSDDYNIKNILEDTENTIEYLTVELQLLTYEEFLDLKEFIEICKEKYTTYAQILYIFFSGQKRKNTQKQGRLCGVHKTKRK